MKAKKKDMKTDFEVLVGRIQATLVRRAFRFPPLHKSSPESDGAMGVWNWQRVMGG